MARGQRGVSFRKRLGLSATGEAPANVAPEPAGLGESASLLLAQEVTCLQLSTRAANCLRLAQVETVGDLVNLTSADILRWPRAGDKTLRELRALLRAVEPRSRMNPRIKMRSFLASSRVATSPRGPRGAFVQLGSGPLRILAALKSADVLRWHHAGETTLSEIRAFLRRLGLSLADGDPALGPGGSCPSHFPRWISSQRRPARVSPRALRAPNSLPGQPTAFVGTSKNPRRPSRSQQPGRLGVGLLGKGDAGKHKSTSRRIGLALSDGDIAGSQTGAADLPRSAPSTVLEEEPSLRK